MGRSCDCPFQSNASAPQSHVCKTLNLLALLGQQHQELLGMFRRKSPSAWHVANRQRFPGAHRRSLSPPFPRTQTTRLFLFQVLLLNEMEQW